MALVAALATAAAALYNVLIQPLDTGPLQGVGRVLFGVFLMAALCVASLVVAAVAQMRLASRGR